MAELEMQDAGSLIGHNIIMFKKELGKDPRSLTPQKTRILIKELESPIHPEEEWKMHLLKDMLLEREELKAEGKLEDVELIQSFCDILCVT